MKIRKKSKKSKIHSRKTVSDPKPKKSLRLSEDKFRSLIENSQDAIALIDQSGKSTYISPSYEKILGRRIQDRLGRSFFEIIHPEDLPRVRKSFEDLINKPGATVSAQMRIKHNNGEWRTIEALATNHLKNPIMKGIILNFRDMTERRSAEEALERSERKFRALVENAYEQFSILDKDGKRIYESPSLERILGFKPGERGGTTYNNHPESEVPLAHEVMSRTMAQPGVPINTELHVRKKDGTFGLFEMSVTNLLHDPSVAGIVVNGRDVTEKRASEKALKRSEENFRNLIEFSPDAIMVHSLDKIYYVNPAFLCLTGFEKEEELLGRSPFILIPPEFREPVIDRVQKLARGDRYAPPAERRIIRKNREQVPVEVLSFSIQFEGQPMAVALLRDLTDRKKAEQALLKYERLGTIGEMAAGMAHEIRNPLSGISLSTQYLMQKLQGMPEAEEQLRNILEQTQRLKELVNDTLDYTRDKSMEEKSVLDAMDLFNASLRLAQVQFGPKNAKFMINWEFEKGMLSLNVNQHRIQQVLVNLILNAFQAMGEEGSLTLGCGKAEGWFNFRVMDDGPGIPEDVKGRIFEPFFTTKQGGSGLGLSVCQKVARSYGGEIQAEGVSPRGAMFTLKLPIKEVGVSQ